MSSCPLQGAWACHASSGTREERSFVFGFPCWPKLWCTCFWDQKCKSLPFIFHGTKEVSRPPLTSKWMGKCNPLPRRQRARSIWWVALVMATSALANINTLPYLFHALFASCLFTSKKANIWDTSEFSSVLLLHCLPTSPRTKHCFAFSANHSHACFCLFATFVCIRYKVLLCRLLNFTYKFENLLWYYILHST